MSSRRTATIVAAAALVLLTGCQGQGDPAPAIRTPEPASTVAPVTPATPSTVPDDQQVVRIAVAGDTGTRDAAEDATARAMVSEAGTHSYDAVILLGDLVYEDGDAALTDRSVTEPFAPVVGARDLIPVLGNHDYRSGEQGQILAQLGRSSPWYVQRVGRVRVVVLDSNRVDDPAQTAWLRGVLAEPQPDGVWTIAAMHHPAYSAGVHGSNLTVRNMWGDLFAQAGVPLVLAGHDHDYQRSTPQRGVTYVVSGAGAKLRPTGKASFTAVSASTRHFLDLRFHSDRLVGRAVGLDGTVIDEFTIKR